MGKNYLKIATKVLGKSKAGVLAKKFAVPYRFEQIEDDTFKLTLKYPVSKGLFEQILFKSLEAYKKKNNIEVVPKDIDSFEADPKMFGVIGTFVSKNLKKSIAREEANGVKIHSADMAKVLYVRLDNGSWEVHVVYNGVATFP